MIILALETSAKVAGAAIYRDGALLAESYLDAGLTHSQTVLPLAENLMLAARVAPVGIDVFACATGPGSFTGLRIGAGAVKGMALAAGKPCAAVSSLEALAWNLAGFPGLIVPAMDARREQVYAAAFRCRSGAPERLLPDGAFSILELGEKIRALNDESVIFVGDGAHLCLAELSNILPEARIAAPNLIFQRAGSVAAAAHRMALENKLISAENLAPAYCRLPQAERERLEKM